MVITGGIEPNIRHLDVPINLQNFLIWLKAQLFTNFQSQEKLQDQVSELVKRAWV